MSSTTGRGTKPAGARRPQPLERMAPQLTSSGSGSRKRSIVPPIIEAVERPIRAVVQSGDMVIPLVEQ